MFLLRADALVSPGCVLVFGFSSGLKGSPEGRF